MAAPPCDDANNLVTAWASHVYAIPVPVPGACVANRRRCQKTNSANHQDIVGNRIYPYDVCDTCKLRGSAITNRNRKSTADPPAAPFNIRARGTLLNGINGAWTRGVLCNRCTDHEIAAYWNRRYVGRRKTAAQARSTCKCEKELRKYYCIQDSMTAFRKIQDATDAIAGTGAAAWLRHIEHDPQTNRATYNNLNAGLLARRAAAGMSPNACRCGRDVAPAPANTVPVPVAACTACSGVIVDVNHPRVTGYAFNHITGEDEANMDYGRRLH